MKSKMSYEWWNEIVFWDGLFTRKELYSYLLHDGYSRQYARFHAGDAMQMLPHEIEDWKRRHPERVQKERVNE